jgi:hypothetical protein
MTHRNSGFQFPFFYHYPPYFTCASLLCLILTFTAKYMPMQYETTLECVL